METKKILLAVFCTLFLIPPMEASNGNAEYKKWGEEARKGNYKKAFQWAKKAADLGNRDAESTLAWNYETGIGVAKDDKKAMEWWLKAAGHGNTFAMNRVATSYQLGTMGVKKDAAKAISWFVKSADSGNGIAQLTLAEMYGNGKGVARDKAKAMEWFEKAKVTMAFDPDIKAHIEAEQKKLKRPEDDGTRYWFQALANLGEKHYEEAIQLLNKVEAERNTYPDIKMNAEIELGNCYLTGSGVAKDIKKAREFFEKAARIGGGEAEILIGQKYFVQKNDSEAMKWLEKSAAHGNKTAKDTLGILREQITPGSNHPE